MALRLKDAAKGVAVVDGARGRVLDMWPGALEAKVARYPAYL